MRKTLFIIFSAAALLLPQSLDAWWRYGHEVVVEIAKRHLNDKARARIDAVMPNDLTVDAGYMDDHRRDKGLEFAYFWHNYMMDRATLEMDPNYGFCGGNAVTGINQTEEYFKQFDKLDKENQILAIRLIIHFVGDLHCPAHVWTQRVVQKWQCYIDGKNVGSFHGYYDTWADRAFEGKTPAEAAEILDTATKCQYRKISRGHALDWAKETAKRCFVIYELNPPPANDPTGRMDLKPETEQQCREISEYQLRAAGYRLAEFLNRYLGK